MQQVALHSLPQAKIISAPQCECWLEFCDWLVWRRDGEMWGKAKCWQAYPQSLFPQSRKVWLCSRWGPCWNKVDVFFLTGRPLTRLWCEGIENIVVDTVVKIVSSGSVHTYDTLTEQRTTTDIHTLWMPPSTTQPSAASEVLEKSRSELLPWKQSTALLLRSVSDMALCSF